MKMTGKKKARNGVEAQCLTRVMSRFLMVNAHTCRISSIVRTDTQKNVVEASVVPSVYLIHLADRVRHMAEKQLRI